LQNDFDTLNAIYEEVIATDKKNLRGGETQKIINNLGSHRSKIENKFEEKFPPSLYEQYAIMGSNGNYEIALPKSKIVVDEDSALGGYMRNNNIDSLEII